jgi:hypothetical protein
MSDMGKRYGDRQTAIQADRTQQKARPDIIEQLRDEAQFLSDRSVDRKALADAAQPLYASLDDQQRRRFPRSYWTSVVGRVPDWENGRPDSKNWTER